MRRLLSLLALAASAAMAGSALATPEPGITLYHVGYDNSPLVNFGPYTGLSNPNYQRLTFLWSHTFIDRPTSNHFHWIGQYSYSGDPLNPEPGFSSNNSIPEPYQQDDGLSLLAGSGAFEGMYISGLGAQEFPEDEIELEYADLGIYPMDELFQYDGQPDPDGIEEYHPGHYLLDTLSGTFKGSVADVTVGMKLVGISPGLAVYDESGSLLMDSVDDVVTMGPGADWSFNPVFAVDESVGLGSSFEATFILQDLSDTPVYGDSAEFTFSFITVPEPSAAAIGLLALAGFVVRRR